MLQFKSEPIRLLLTFFKAAPLVAGYVSESQTLSLKFRGFTEGEVPTACLKVTIEQRAEYRPGAGIPELYDASLILESELPLFKRIIWYWKKTIFIWISIMSFMMQLLFTLVCCRSIIIPKLRPRDVVPSNSATQNSPPVRGGVASRSATGNSSPVQGWERGLCRPDDNDEKDFISDSWAQCSLNSESHSVWHPNFDFWPFLNFFLDHVHF